MLILINDLVWHFMSWHQSQSLEKLMQLTEHVYETHLSAHCHQGAE